jgi:hypothetical protein
VTATVTIALSCLALAVILSGLEQTLRQQRERRRRERLHRKFDRLIARSKLRPIHPPRRPLL